VILSSSKIQGNGLRQVSELCQARGVSLRRISLRLE